MGKAIVMIINSENLLQIKKYQIKLTGYFREAHLLRQMINLRMIKIIKVIEDLYINLEFHKLWGKKYKIKMML